MKEATLLDIIGLSTTYNRKYGVTKEDVERANSLIRVIQESRDITRPQEGDIIICKGPEKEYPNGHFEYFWGAGFYTVCVRPSTPFVYLRSENGEAPFANFTTSGGYWLNFEKEDLDMFQYERTEMKTFCAWGHCGACGNGAFRFKARVNVWNLFREDIY